MSRPSLFRAVFAVVLASALATPGATAVGDLPAPPAEIASAIADCAKAVTPGDFDGKLLEGAGWKFGGKGQTKMGGLPVDQYFFGKENGNVINVVQVANKLSTSCMTIAKVANADSDLTVVRSNIEQQFGAKKFNEYQGDEYFKAFVKKTAPAEADKTMIGDHQRFVVSLKPGTPATLTVLMNPKRVEK